MHIQALVASLALATIVAALPLAQEGTEWPSLKDSLNDIGNSKSTETTRGNSWKGSLTFDEDNENNPEVGSDNGNNNGNNNGSGNTIGQNKFEFSGDNNFLTDLVNVSCTDTWRRPSREGSEVTNVQPDQLWCDEQASL